jgi:hypothetical protein
MRTRLCTPRGVRKVDVAVGTERKIVGGIQGQPVRTMIRYKGALRASHARHYTVPPLAGNELVLGVDREPIGGDRPVRVRNHGKVAGAGVKAIDFGCRRILLDYIGED